MKKYLNARKISEKGMTFVEVIIVIVIFSIMASIVLFKFGDFNKKATLNNLVQDIALRIVEAQKTAISGVNNTNITAGTAPAYGVYFVSGSATDTANKKFIFFTDIPGGTSTVGDKLYQISPADPTAPCRSPYSRECMSVTSITTGEYISRICYSTAPTVYACSSTTPASAQISFVRPFPDATMRYCASTTACTATPPAIDTPSMLIEVTSGITSTMKKTIIVNTLGSVRVYDGTARNACLSFGSGYTCP